MSNLLSLPTVVWSELLDLMDLHNLKKLRSVCKQTKNMVEQPKYLQNFKLALRNVKCQETVLSSIVPWNNFVLNLDQDVLPAFLTQYGKFIEHLEIKNGLLSGEVDVISNILNHLTPKIQTLIIEAVFINPSSIQSPIWGKNFIALKKFQIHGIMNFPDAPKTLFEIILDNCTNKLTHLSIPSLLRGYRAVTEFLDTSLILQAILNYLKRIEESQAQTSLSIDFHFRREVQQLNPEILLSIVEISSRLGVKLLHVPIQGLPMNYRSLTIPQREMFEKSVVSVVEIVDKKVESLHPRVESKENTYIPRNAQFHVRIDVNTRPDDDAGFECRFPIYGLEVSCTWFPRLQDPYPDIFQTQRRTVQKLDIRSFREREDSRVMNFGLDISFSFPNLKDLCVSFCTCMYTEDFNSLILGLPILEKLRIVSSNLNDRGLLGEGLRLPYMLRMKKLKHLELLWCDDLTDKSFTHVFRFMNLETFKWTYYDYESTQVTFLNGISSLNTIDGGLKDSVQRLEFTSPGDCSRYELDEFVNKFKSLTYFNVENLNLLIERERKKKSDGEDNYNDWETYSENMDAVSNDENEIGSSDEEDQQKNETNSESDEQDE